MIFAILLVICGVGLGAHGASFAMAFMERAERKRLGRPADPKRWVCRKCGHVLEVNETVPIMGFLTSYGYCPYCGCKIPQGLFTAEIAGALCGAVISLTCVLDTPPIRCVVIALLCVELLDIALYEMCFNKVNKWAVLRLVIVLVLFGTPVRNALISIVLIIFYAMAYDVLRDKAIKSGELDKEHKHEFEIRAFSVPEFIEILIAFNLFGVIGTFVVQGFSAMFWVLLTQFCQGVYCKGLVRGYGKGEDTNAAGDDGEGDKNAEDDGDGEGGVDTDGDDDVTAANGDTKATQPESNSEIPESKLSDKFRAHGYTLVYTSMAIYCAIIFTQLYQ